MFHCWIQGGSTWGKLIFEIVTAIVKELECRRVQNYRYYSDVEGERTWYIVLLLYEAKKRRQPKLQITLIKTVFLNALCCYCCWVASVMSDSVRPHRRQPTRLHHPWDSSGKNTGVGCHFLLQCMKGKSESEVAQSCPTLRDPRLLFHPWDFPGKSTGVGCHCSLQMPLSKGIKHASEFSSEESTSLLNSCDFSNFLNILNGIKDLTFSFF